MQSVSFEVGGDGSHISPWDSVTSAAPRVAGEAPLTWGGLREGVLNVCMCMLGVGHGVSRKVREESGNECLLSTYYMLDSFYMLSKKFYH